MVRLLRLLLIWLLITALPIQGFAAVMRNNCVMGQSPASATMPTILQAEKNLSVHSHHAGMSNEEMSENPVLVVHDHPADHTHHHKTATCNFCGSCCVGAFAIPASLALLPKDAKTSVEFITPPPLVTGFIPDGLERPPRHLSA